MADNAAQSIKDLQKDLAALDKQLLSNNANWDKLGQTIVDSMKRGGLGLDDLFSKMKGQKDVLKLRAIIDRDALMDDVKKLQTAVDKGVKSVKVGGVEITGQKQIEQALDGYKAQLKLVPKTLAEAYDYAVKIANTLSVSKSKEGTAWSRARADEMNARKKAIDDVTRTEGRLLKLEQELSRYKEGGSRWKNVKSQIEAANKELEVYREKLKLLASRGKSALDANTGTVGFSKETKQLIQEGRDATREAERLAKVKQKDAEWQEQQRRNTEAQFVANGKAIEQQRKLADQIDILTRKRQALAKYTTDSSVAFDSRNYPLASAYQKQIEDLIRLRQQLDRQFSGSMKAGDLAFADTKTLRDQEEAQKRITAEQKQRDKERADAARQRAAIERKADSESLANQRRQIQIKAQLSAIDKARNSDRDVSSKKAKAQVAEENAEYKRLSAELTRLIARQKELNAISQGSGSRARGRLQTYEITASEQALRRYEEAWRRVNREQKLSDDNMRKMLSTVSRLASAFGVAFSVQGLVNFGRKLVETRGEFELQQVALRSILQNKQLADEIWDKTMKAALQSPFTAMQLTKYTKQLAAYRIETDKLFDTTKRLADVSAGLGVDMQRLILAYGQVKAANYLRASEIRQFTEAGVNVLGELRDYFNDVKGMSVDTAKVMDMVQKRLVTFSDVEAIFKRMTDQGGIFYNMQYVQSQTVKGQINKLHDAYDQMLNSIGKANEGAIKNMVSLLNNIVKNWREWKTVLDTIAWPLMITSVIKFGRGLLTVGSSARIAAGEIKGLELAGTKLRNFIGKTNPWMALATAVIAATFALINHVKAVRATQKEIDEQNLRLYETNELMSGYQKTLEENNKAIKEGKLSEDELSKKRKENSGIIAKLKEQYPDIVRGLDLERDGTDKLTESLKNYNDELERRMTLQNMLGTGGGWFSDTVRDNMQQWETDLSDLKGQLLSVQSNARGGMMKMELKGEQDSPLYSELKKISELDLSDVIKASKEYEDILERIFSAPMRDARWDIDPNANYISKGIDIYGFRLLQLEQFPHDIKQVSKESNIAFKNFITSLEHDFESSVSNIKEYSDKISQEYGNDVLRFIANNTDLINQGVLDGNADVVKTIRTVLQSAGVGLTEESRKFYNQLLNERILYLKYQEALNDAEEKSFFRRTQNAMEARKSYVPIDFFATPASSSTADPTSGTENNGNKAKESVSAMISLIKEMNSEYGKLSKSAYGFAKSQDKVTDSFRESFEQIFRVRGGKGTYINYDDIDFTNKAGAAKALQDVFDQIENAKAWGKFAKNAKDEMLKAISGLEVEADIEVKTRIREDFGRQMEDAFSDFQLTLDLEKLNLPHSLMQTMFDMDAVDLADMRQKLSELSRTLLDENGVMSDDNWKVYNDWLKKIEDKERDMQRQRMKDYSKYLEYQLSERAKLEMEYAKKVAEVQSESAFDDNTRSRILRGLQEEYDKKIAKQDWEDFKGSEMYVEMMEDLTRQGTASLEEMRKKLVEVRDNSENLSPRALKEVVNALQKIDEVVDSRVSPFARIKNLGKDLKNAMKESGFDNMRDVFAADEDAKRRYQELKDEYDEIQAVIGAKQQEKEIEEQLGDYRNSSIASLQNLINKKKEEKKSEDEAIASLGVRDKSNQQEIESRTKVSNALQGEIDKYESIIKLLKQLEEAQKTIRGSSKYGNTDLGLLSVDSDTHKEQMDAAESTTKRLGIITRLWQRLRKATQESLEATKEYLNSTKDLIDSSYTLLQNFGAKTDEVSDQWKQFVDTFLDSTVQSIDAFKKFAEAQDNVTKGIAKGIATGDYIRLILSLLSAVAKVASELSLFRGARIDKEIREQQEYIDELAMAYDRLEKAIEKTVTTSGYLATYNKQIQNTYQQIAATEAQLAAAQNRKRVDQSEVNGYRSTLNELYDQLEDLQSQMQETFGGIGGESNYRSWAEEFVSEWRSAFLETGDGLDALEDHFDEFLQSWFEKQATMRIAGRMLEPLMSMIDQSVDDGILTRMELDRIKERASEIFPQLNEQLREFYETMGFGDGNGSLSGLAKAISGMSEEQADILAAYGNSIRMYAASIDLNVAAIANALGIGDASPSANPMLQQISIIARNTSSIYTLLDSVVMPGHSKGRSGLKIFLN